MLLWDQLSFLLLFLPRSGWWREIRQDWTGESSSRRFLQRTTPLISDFCFSDDSPTSCPLSSCISCVTARRGWIREESEECLHYLICKGCSRLIIPSYNLSSPCSPPDLGGLNGGLVGLQALALPPQRTSSLCVNASPSDALATFPFSFTDKILFTNRGQGQKCIKMMQHYDRKPLKLKSHSKEIKLLGPRMRKCRFLYVFTLFACTFISVWELVQLIKSKEDKS